MTVKVGDKVRIVGNGAGGLNRIGSVGVVAHVSDEYYLVEFDGDPRNFNYQLLSDLELVTVPTPTPISTQCREKMEDHMVKGEYVRAVKWAQLAEQAEALENE